MPVKSLLSIIGLFCCCAYPALANEFQPIGFESIGMGGAGVACARGSMSPYYNPALLTVHRYPAEFDAGVGTGVREYNLAEQIDTLADMNLTDTLNNIAAKAPFNGSNTQTDRDNVTNAQQVLAELSTGDHRLSLMPTVGTGIQIGRLGIGAYGTSDGTARPIVDGSRLDLIVKQTVGGIDGYYAYNALTDTYSLSSQNQYEAQSLEYALNSGKTYLQLTGLAMVECPISYACQFKSPLGPLSVGGSFKLLAGTTYNGQAKIDTESGEISDELDNADKTSNTYSYDAGVVWQPKGFNNLAIGAVGKYLNSPKFDIANTNAKYTVEPLWRTGIAYSCLHNRLDFAADYDLTKNTQDDGSTSQYLGGGLNYHPTSWLSLRAGVMQNLANNDELGTIGTAGIGIGFKWVQFDISAQMSTNKGYYNGNETPRYARLNAAFVSRW